MKWGKKERMWMWKGTVPSQVSTESWQPEAPQSILVTYKKSKTRGKHVRPKDSPGSWIWYSDFKSLYTFEQKRLRPFQGPVSILEDDEMTPLLVLWVCQGSSMVDWQTLYLKAQSRRPLLRCAEMLRFVMSPSRRLVGAAKMSKRIGKTRFAGHQAVHGGGQSS